MALKAPASEVYVVLNHISSSKAGHNIKVAINGVRILFPHRVEEERK